MQELAAIEGVQRVTTAATADGRTSSLRNRVELTGYVIRREPVVP